MLLMLELIIIFLQKSYFFLNPLLLTIYQFRIMINIFYNIGYQMQEQNLLAQKNALPITYFDLMKIVGSDGIYQFKTMLIFVIMWFVTGTLLMSTGFFFLNKPFNCSTSGLLVEDCNNAVCKLQQYLWANYIDKQFDFVSIATQFGQYYCEDQFFLDLSSSSTYFGCLVGYLIFSFFSDNFGRKISLVLAWGTTTIGLVFLVCSVNLEMAAIGLFLSGLGSDASINICFYYLNQIVENNKRQKYAVLMQMSFCIGALVITILFYLFENWRIVAIINLTAPSIIAFIFIIIYLEQTPRFLIRKGIHKTIKAMNRIGQINKKQQNLLLEKHVVNVMENQVAVKQFNKIITPLDLLRFPSLRSTTICLIFISMMLFGIYYGPIIVISQIGFNIYATSVAMHISQMICYIPLYLFVQQIPRQKTSIVLFTISGLCTGLLIFVTKPQNCNMCAESIIELIVIFVLRFCVNLQFGIFQIYYVELFPARARGLGGGIIMAMGTFASSMSPLFLGVLRRNKFNLMIVFTFYTIVAIGALTLLRQTLGLPLLEEIQQVTMQKNRRKSHLQQIKKTLCQQSEDYNQIQQEQQQNKEK